MRLLLVAVLLFSGLQAFAQGAQDYPTLDSVKAAGFYRLTCSDTVSDIQVHTYLEIENDVVKSLKILTIAPAKSLNVIEYKAKDLKNIVVVEGSTIKISGDRDGAYWDESYRLNVGADLKATFEYDDGDGMSLDRKMNCGAVNYILNPRQ